MAEVKELAEAERIEKLAAGQAEILQTMETLASGGYTWVGIMEVRLNSPMDSVEKIKGFYSEKYGVDPEDIHIVEDAAIYGGTTPTTAPGNVTVYIRRNMDSDS